MIELKDFVLKPPRFIPIGTWVTHEQAVLLYNWKESRDLAHVNRYNGKPGYKSVNRRVYIDVGLHDPRRKDYALNQAQRNYFYMNYFYSLSEIARMVVDDLGKYKFESMRSFLSQTLFETKFIGRGDTLDDWFEWSNKFLADYVRRTYMENNYINLKNKFWDKETLRFQIDRLRQNGHKVESWWIKRAS